MDAYIGFLYADHCFMVLGLFVAEWLVWACGWSLSATAMVMVIQLSFFFDHQHAMLQVQRRSVLAIQYLTGRLRMAGQLHCTLSAPSLLPALKVYPSAGPRGFVKRAQSDVVVMRQCDQDHAAKHINTAFFVDQMRLEDQGSAASALYMQYEGGVKQALVPGVVGMNLVAYNARGVVASDRFEPIAGLAITLRICADRGCWASMAQQPYCQQWHAFIVPRL